MLRSDPFVQMFCRIGGCRLVRGRLSLDRWPRHQAANTKRSSKSPSAHLTSEPPPSPQTRLASPWLRLFCCDTLVCSDFTAALRHLADSYDSAFLFHVVLLCLRVAADTATNQQNTSLYTCKRISIPFLYGLRALLRTLRTQKERKI